MYTADRNDAMQKYVDNLVLQIMPELTDADSRQRTSLIAVLKYLRPYVEHAVDVHAPKLVRAIEDRRLKSWHLFLAVYHTDVQVFVSNGRRKDTDGTVITFGGEVLQGLDGVASFLAETMLRLGAPAADFSTEKMIKLTNGWRSTLSRERGFCKFNRPSRDGQWAVFGEIMRVEPYD